MGARGRAGKRDHAARHKQSGRRASCATLARGALLRVSSPCAPIEENRAPQQEGTGVGVNDVRGECPCVSWGGGCMIRVGPYTPTSGARAARHSPAVVCAVRSRPARQSPQSPATTPCRRPGAPRRLAGAPLFRPCPCRPRGAGRHCRTALPLQSPYSTCSSSPLTCRADVDAPGPDTPPLLRRTPPRRASPSSLPPALCVRDPALPCFGGRPRPLPLPSRCSAEGAGRWAPLGHGDEDRGPTAVMVASPPSRPYGLWGAGASGGSGGGLPGGVLDPKLSELCSFRTAASPAAAGADPWASTRLGIAARRRGGGQLAEVAEVQ